MLLSVLILPFVLLIRTYCLPDSKTECMLAACEILLQRTDYLSAT